MRVYVFSTESAYLAFCSDHLGEPCETPYGFYRRGAREKTRRCWRCEWRDHFVDDPSGRRAFEHVEGRTPEQAEDDWEHRVNSL